MYTTYIRTCGCMHIICTMTPNKHFHQLLLTNSVSLVHSSHQRFPITQCICRVPRTLTKLHPHLLLHFELPFVSFITCFWDQQFAVWTISEKWLQNFCEIWGAPNFILFLGCMHIICTMTPTSTNFFSQIVFLSSIHPTNAFPSCNAYAGFPHTNQITLPPHLLLHSGLPFVSFITCFWDQQLRSELSWRNGYKIFVRFGEPLISYCSLDWVYGHFLPIFHL